MYNIQQFKPALYVLLIMGLSGFAIAAQEPGLWALSVAAVLVQAGMVYRGRFKPISRLLSNGVCLVALAYMVVEFFDRSNPPVLVIGQFLVVLHLVTLFAQRTNRDYGVLLVLSVLLMVASGITTASLAFGILFIIYIFLSIYCYLLLHLKREADRAIAAQPVPPDRFTLANLRQDQRYLPRSMRKLIAFITTVSSCSAVFVFLFFPRGPGTGVLGQMQMRPSETLTGFSDETQINQLASITQNATPVATVSVWRRMGHAAEQPITTGVLRLRGVTFDRYHQGENLEWEWKRSAESDDPIRSEQDTSPGNPLTNTAGSQVNPLPEGVWRQEVRLDPIGSKALFALAGIRQFTPVGDVKAVYFPTDETLQRGDGNSSIQYEAISNGVLTTPSAALAPRIAYERPAPLKLLMFNSLLPQLSKNIDPAVVQFAHDPQVSGEIAKQRSPTAQMTDLDAEIAANIETYLKTHFAYTLDLSDVEEKFQGKDPLAVFVSQVRRGHCVYFAGAMTLACQSLGIRARMVFGFVTDEYNSIGGYFQVRQSHAHAWVEVLTPNHGWMVFDPTSGRELPPNEQRSFVQRVRHVFDWLESKWTTSVIAYDGSRRTSLIQTLDASLTNKTLRGAEAISRWRKWWHELHLGTTEFWSISIKILVGAISCVLLALVVAIGWFVLERRRIRRRAVKIGLQSLPIPQQLRLARQLGFYEQMNELLQMHRITRRPHMTAMEFSHSLTYLPTESYRLVDALTRIFYRVRYGGAHVPADQQRRLALAVTRLAEQLASYGKLGSLK